MSSPIGRHCAMLMMAVKGDTTVEAAKAVVDKIIQTIGMSPIFEPAVYRYEGDIGLIYIQPIFESFVAYDAWPCHGGGYITVSSCRDFDPNAVMDAAMELGFDIADSEFTELSLP